MSMYELPDVLECLIAILLFLFFFLETDPESGWLSLVKEMGIPGLLQFIKDAAEPINVKKYRGQTVAVDTYCWLHKGAFSCAEKLAKGEPTDQ